MARVTNLSAAALFLSLAFRPSAAKAFTDCSSWAIFSCNSMNTCEASGQEWCKSICAAFNAPESPYLEPGCEDYITSQDQDPVCYDSGIDCYSVCTCTTDEPIPN